MKTGERGGEEREKDLEKKRKKKKEKKRKKKTFPPISLHSSSSSLSARFIVKVKLGLHLTLLPSLLLRSGLFSSFLF